MMECPICNERFPLSSINDHVNECLAKGGGSSPPTAAIADTSPRRGQQTMFSFGGSSSKRKSPSSTSSLERPPPKNRKTMTSTTTTAMASSQRHEAAVSVAGGGGKAPALGTSSQPAGGGAKKQLPGVPLADRLRPTTIDGYVGQEKVVGRDSMLRKIVESGEVPSLIFWGPPGCGKTTLARILARAAREKKGSRFTQLSAAACGVGEVKEAIKIARNERVMFRRTTILFLDEIHRFNKLQQDTFLPHVEDGTITLLGATTENPSFQINSALLSRCRVIVLQKLEPEEIEALLRRALAEVGSSELVEETISSPSFSSNTLSSTRPLPLNSSDADDDGCKVESKAITFLAQFCDGDARSALNALQMAVQCKKLQQQQQQPREQQQQKVMMTKESLSLPQQQSHGDREEAQRQQNKKLKESSDKGHNLMRSGRRNVNDCGSKEQHTTTSAIATEQHQSSRESKSSSAQTADTAVVEHPKHVQQPPPSPSVQTDAVINGSSSNVNKSVLKKGTDSDTRNSNGRGSRDRLPMSPPRPCPQQPVKAAAGRTVVVTIDDIKESLQRTHLLYDRAGEEHFNCISALHKSMRGGDASASLYWLARMLCAGEDPLYVARRVVRFASEDIGLAEPSALSQAVAAFQACQFIGMPECAVVLAQAVVFMARSPKSISVYSAYERAKGLVLHYEGNTPPVPLHLRNAPTRLTRELGYGRGYQYNPALAHIGPVVQRYIPEALGDVDFFADVEDDWYSKRH